MSNTFCSLCHGYILFHSLGRILFCQISVSCTMPSGLQVFSCAISSVCRLKSPYICFSSNFYFLPFVVYLSVLMLPMLLLAAKLNISLIFFMYSSSPCIDVSTQSSVRTTPLPPCFLDKYSLSMSSDECKALWIASSFLVF